MRSPSPINTHSNNKQGHFLPAAGIPEGTPDHKGRGFYRKASGRVVEAETADRDAKTRSRSARVRKEKGDDIVGRDDRVEKQVHTIFKKFCPEHNSVVQRMFLCFQKGIGKSWPELLAHVCRLVFGQHR